MKRSTRLRPARTRPAHSTSPLGRHGHLCGFYTSDVTRTRLATAFLAEGLRAGDAAFFVATPKVSDRVRAALAREGVDPAAGSGVLVTLEYADDAREHLRRIRTHLAAASRGGARAMRLVGDLGGSPISQRLTFDELLGYEAGLDRSIVGRFPLVTLCLFDARVLSGVQVSRVLRAHPDILRPAAELVSD